MTKVVLPPCPIEEDLEEINQWEVPAQYDDALFDQILSFPQKMSSLKDQIFLSSKIVSLIEDAIWWKLKYVESREVADIQLTEAEMIIEELQQTIEENNQEEEIYNLKLQILDLMSKNQELESFKASVLKQEQNGFDERRNTAIHLGNNQKESNQILFSSTWKETPQADLKKIQKLENQLLLKEKSFIEAEKKSHQLQMKLQKSESKSIEMENYLNRHVLRGYESLSDQNQSLLKLCHLYFDKQMNLELFRSKSIHSLSAISGDLEILKAELKQKYTQEKPTSPPSSPVSPRKHKERTNTLRSEKGSISALLEEIRNRAPNLKKVDQQLSRRKHPLRQSMRNLQSTLKYALEKHRMALEEENEEECW